jgi:anti-sigma B factor antagonist
LLLKQEGAPMFSVNLSTHACDGRVVVALRGELDVTDAASVAAALTPVAAREREIIIDLAGLEFIDSSGLAALVLVRKHARHVGGDLILAGPQREVLRVLTVTRLLDVFSVHTCEEKAADGGEAPQGALPAAPGAALLTTA